MKKILTTFLISFNPFIGIVDGIIPLLLLADAKIYGLISKLYSIYLSLAQAEIFNNDMVKNVTSKVYAIIGVVSLFVIAYALLQALINPENAIKSESGGVKILKNFLIALVLIAVIPTIFDFLYDFQKAILTYNTIPKLFLSSGDTSNKTEEIKLQDENGNYIYLENCNKENMNECIATIEVETDYSKKILESYGNEMAYTILNGFLAPIDGLQDDEVVVNASEYFNLSKGIKLSAIACGIGGAAATISVVGLEIATSPATGFATIAAIPGSISAFSGFIVASCFGGAALGGLTSAAGYAFTAKEYTWESAKIAMLYEGNFDVITAFNSAIGTSMNYLPLVSTLAGLIILYMMASFCIDLGVRVAKLAFYELVAPVCLLLSVVPSNKSLLGNYIKTVLTTWLEVFIRIICVCGLAYLISNLNNLVFDDLGLLAKAIIVMGLVVFIKQFPKLLEDITGIKSGNMKLGIMDKLKEGGALAAGAVIGGGLISGAQNLTSGARNMRNKWKEDTNNNLDFKHKAANLAAGAAKSTFSTTAGVLSGSAHSFRTGASAKNLKDMQEASRKGSKVAMENRIKRANYKSSHSAGKGFLDNLGRTALGHVSDTLGIAGSILGVENKEELKDENERMEQITRQRDNFDDKINELILKEVKKGATSVAGVKIDQVAKLKQTLEQKRAQGTATIADEAAYEQALMEARLRLENNVLVSNDNWNKYSLDLQAKLSGVRVEAVKLKGVIRNNSNLEALKNAGIVGSDYADNTDVIIGELKANGKWDDVATIDNMNKGIKRKKGENNIAIATMEQQPKEEQNKR